MYNYKNNNLQQLNILQSHKVNTHQIFLIFALKNVLLLFYILKIYHHNI